MAVGRMDEGIVSEDRKNSEEGKLMKKMKKVAALLRVNLRTMAEFELLYKFLSLSVFTPVFWGAFNGIMKITGYKYLTIENVLPFLLNPLTLAMLLLLFICMAFYTMIDIGAVIFLLDQSYQGKKADLVQTARYAVRNALRVFHRKNILIAFVVLFLIPFLNIGVASGYVSSIAIPEFILDFIKGNGRLLVFFAAAVAGLGILLLRWLYAFHYFTLEECGFKEARKRSAELGRKHKIRDLLALLGIQLGISVLFLVYAIVGIGLAVLLGRLLSKLKWLGIVSASVVWVFIAVSFFIVSALGTPVSYACISILFYGRKEEKKEKIVHGEPDDRRESAKRRKIRYAVEGILLSVSVVCCGCYLYGVYNHKISVQIEYVRTMEMTAHRGASACYPENTMAAFEGAKDLGADWIELDVQQSRDGQIFVMHDTNFLRTAGVDKNTWEMDYDEIRSLDVGSFFDSSFEGESAPLLSEVIAFAKKNGIRLNIEMKPTGHEEKFEENVAEIIEAERFWEQCVITSQVYDVLEAVKTYDDRIHTVYVMSLAYGDINMLTAADHFSIEASSITEKLVSDIHNAGKEIYAWTVNTEESIGRMIELNVDNIITDNVTLAKECIYLSKTSDVVAEYVKWISK